MKYSTMQEIEQRKAAILEEMNKDDANLDALKAEMEELRENAAEIKKAADKAAETRKQIAQGLAGTVMDAASVETASDKTLDEIRASKEYVEAYARYILSEDDKECRALLTKNAPASGQVPVPVFVDQIIRTAWDNDPILARVRRTEFRGNVQVPFEKAADPAYVHEEGYTAQTEESLEIGIVSLIPKNIKKYIRISDELVDMGGEALLRYIYDELTHQIVKKLAALCVTDIASANTSHGSTAIGIPKVTGAPSLTIVPEAEAQLTDEAENLVVVMNRKTSAAFVAARAAGNFAVDPYDGLVVIYSDALPAYADASASDVYAIVGDLFGEQVNYPAGDGVVIKFDDMSEAEKDLVKVVGRQYAAHGLTGPGRLCNIVKPAPVTT